MPSEMLVKQIEMELGEARNEIGRLEAARAALMGHANGSGPETQPAGPRKPGRPRKATTRASANGRRKTATGRRRTANGRRKAPAKTRRAASVV